MTHEETIIRRARWQLQAQILTVEDCVEFWKLLGKAPIGIDEGYYNH